MITGRVHSAEVGGSHMINGLVDFLFSEDKRSKVLLEAFIFVVVPMLNPDGVYSGYSRLDTFGNDLNRCY